MQSFDSQFSRVPDGQERPRHDDAASSALIFREQIYPLGSIDPTIDTEDHLTIVQETDNPAYTPDSIKPDFAEAFRTMDAILKIGESNPRIGSRFNLTFRNLTRTLEFTGLDPLLSLFDLFTTPVSLHSRRNEAETAVLVCLLKRRLALTKKLPGTKLPGAGSRPLSYLTLR